MDGLQEAFAAGVMLTWLSIGVMKIVLKNLREEWNQ